MSSHTVATREPLAVRSRGYLNYLDRWFETRREETIASIVARAGGPGNVAVVSVDLIVGFCHSGPLSSQRVAGILPAVRDLLTTAHDAGLRHIVLTQDTHREDAEEFGSYPPHCVRGTAEAETVQELASLPFADMFSVIEKNSISSVIEPAFVEWDERNGPFAAYIVVGDCTDLCVYQAAMALKTRSLTHHRGQRIIVPIDCVQTYDMPVETAV